MRRQYLEVSASLGVPFAGENWQREGVYQLRPRCLNLINIQHWHQLTGRMLSWNQNTQQFSAAAVSIVLQEGTVIPSSPWP